MTPTASLYLIRQVAFATGVVAAGLCGPVILISLRNHLPDPVFYSALVWPALSGIAPMIVFLVLPVCAGVAATWCYGRYYSEGMITVLQSAGYSNLAVFAPGLIMAAATAAIAYSLSCYVAPHGVRNLQDVIFQASNYPDVAILEEGAFHASGDGRRMLSFGKRLQADVLEDVFLRETADGGERIFTASRALVENGADGSYLVLLDGSSVSSEEGEESRFVSFQRMTLPVWFGKHEARGWTALLELDTGSFLRARPAFGGPLGQATEWLSEAVKRFAIPLLALGHTMLGIGILSIWSDRIGRQRQITPLVCAGILGLHGLIVVAAELGRGSMPMIIFAATAVPAVIGIAAILLWFRRSAGRTPLRARRATRRSSGAAVPDRAVRAG
jgi:lipopolysaccharide export system permease protein